MIHDLQYELGSYTRLHYLPSSLTSIGSGMAKYLVAPQVSSIMTSTWKMPVPMRSLNGNEVTWTRLPMAFVSLFVTEKGKIGNISSRLRCAEGNPG